MVVTAGETIAAAYTVVYLDSTDSGYAKKAQCDGTSAEADAVGITLGAIADDATGVVQTAGQVTNASWTWTPGAALYVSATAGSLTETKPTTIGYYVKPMGYAISATTIVLDPDSGWLIGGDTSLFIPGGRLFVPPSYYATASDTAIQVDAANDWVAQKFVAECDYTIYTLAVYITAVATQGVFTVELYSHDATNDQPNASLETLYTDLDCGAAADAWIYASVTNYALQRGQTYWLVIKGTDGDDYSLSCNNYNTTLGTMFPDSMLALKSSTDGGSSWAAVTSNSKPACLNMILNYSAGPSTRLWYGRYNSNYCYIPTEGLYEIPEGGYSLIITSFTADTIYYIYGYVSASAFALLGSTDPPVLSDGMLVQTGHADRRYLGMIYAKTITPGDEGVVDCMDSRLVVNEYNKVPKPVGKLCPYPSATADTGVSNSWEGWNGSATAFKFEFLSDGNPVSVSYSVLGVIGADETVYAAMGMDAASVYDGVSGSMLTSTAATSSVLSGAGVLRPDVGYHYGLPLQKAGTADQGDMHFEVAGTVYGGTSGVRGTIWL